MIFILSLLAAAAGVWYVSEVAAEAMTGTIQPRPAAPASQDAYLGGERGSRPEGTGQLPRLRTIGSGIPNSHITSERCDVAALGCKASLRVTGRSSGNHLHFESARMGHL